MRTHRGGLTCALLLATLLCPTHTWAAEQDDNRMASAIRQFYNGEWETAVQGLEQLLATGGLATADRSQARKFLAMAYLSLGQDGKALSVFKDIVRDDPDFGMDALTLGEGERPPPEAVRHFGQAVVEVRQEEIRAREEQLSRASRLSASLRSAALPGWGQRYLGYGRRGYLMMGAATLSLAYAVKAEADYRGARDDYKRAATGADFPALYSKYVTKSDRADLAWGVLAGVWLFNVADAWIQGPNIAAAETGFALQGAPGGAGLRGVFYSRF